MEIYTMKQTALVPSFGMPTSGAAFLADARADVCAAIAGAIPGSPTWSPPTS